MAIGTDLALLTLKPGRDRPWGGPRTEYAMRAAELVDLAVAQHVTLLGDRLAVLDAGPVGYPPLDAALATLAEATNDCAVQPPTVAEWVGHRPYARTHEYLATLADADMSRRITGPRRAVKLDTLVGHRLPAAVDRLTRTVAAGSRAPFEDRAYVALADAGQLARRHLKGRTHRDARKGLKPLLVGILSETDLAPAAGEIFHRGYSAVAAYRPEGPAHDEIVWSQTLL